MRELQKLREGAYLSLCSLTPQQAAGCACNRFQHGQLDDGTCREITRRLQAAAPLAAVHRRARQSRCPQTRPDPHRLVSARFRQITLRGAIPQPEIRRIARTGGPGMTEQDNVLRFANQLGKIAPCRPCRYGQAAQDNHQDPCRSSDLQGTNSLLNGRPATGANRPCFPAVLNLSA